MRRPREILEARERSRRDRTVGQAVAQFDVVHRRGGYDVEVDASVLSPTEAAAAVLAAGFPRRPFARLRA